MKKVFQLLTFLTISVMIYSQNSATISLNSGWQFSEAGKNEWKDAVVPGSVQSDLIRLGILPDPYYGTNENVVQWPEEKDWDYKQTFTVTPEQLKSDEA
ncbi:MAG: beta-mannosidase, partial [Bacteroidetes bacterium]|nr:beta-mannosidase [Bacteroidota bacterium]